MKHHNFKIAVVDSGIDASHKRLKNCSISGCNIVESEGKVSVVENEFYDDVGHGTAVVAIIHRFVPNVEIFGVKIFSEEQQADESLLGKALERCLEDEAIKIINLSLGIAKGYKTKELKRLCEQAYSKNVIIIASANNAGKECYPAYFDSVIAVTSGYIKDKFDYGYVGDSGVNFIAKGVTQRIAWKDGGYKITSGTSYATPHFTGIVASYLLNSGNNLSINKLLALLKKSAKTGIRPLIQNEEILHDGFNLSPKVNIKEKVFYHKNELKKIKKVALFPVCEKEFSTLLKFPHNCPFKITQYYDYPRFLRIKSSDIPSENIKTSIEDSDFEKFDTIVLGYFLEQQFDVNVLMGIELIEKGLNKDKSFVVWDFKTHNFIKKEIETNFKNYKGEVIVPYADKLLGQNLFNHLPDVSVPVITVIGSSNKQGKITIQMRLRNLLADEGYKVSHVITEPQGILLDADYCFPYGKNQTINIDEACWGEHLYSVFRAINYHKEPHLILTGTQGCLIPRIKNLTEMTSSDNLKSLKYLISTLPDAVICALNPEDTLDMIENIMKTIDIFTNAKILFFTMHPFMREVVTNDKGITFTNNKVLDKNELNEKMQYIEKMSKIPVLDIMDLDNSKKILNIIETAF